MHAIVLATADGDFRSSILEKLATQSHAIGSSATWAETTARTVDPQTQLVLVDASLPGADGRLLLELAKLPDGPEVRAVRGELLPLRSIQRTAHMRRLANSAVKPALTPSEQKMVKWVGLGSGALKIMREAARNPLPLRIQGARGTGKEGVARLIHRLVHEHSPFVLVRPGDEPVVRSKSTGTLYLENLDLHTIENISGTRHLAKATGWRVMAGSREPPTPHKEGVAWVPLHLRSLRERPRDIHPLTRYYVNTYCQRLHLPRRKISRALWTRIEQYPWPGNHRELETFVVQAVTAAEETTLRPENLPRRILKLLEVDTEETPTRAYEAMVEKRLSSLVFEHQAVTDAPSLHRLVMDATERPLFRLALVRTGGNQKAAAELLGLARNTLRTRISRLDPFDEVS